jgi:Ni/Co efflux regulator RcnB
MLHEQLRVFISYSSTRPPLIDLARARPRLNDLPLVETNMKSKALVCALAAVSLATGQLAFAQDGGDRTGHDRADQAQQNNQQDGNRSSHDRRAQPQRRQDQQNRGKRVDERGAGPEHAWHRGDRLPNEYRSNQYVVDDWRGHHLSAPPRGYHWVQTGGDYVLVAITTGIILQLLLNN